LAVTRHAWYWLSLAAFVLALLSKTSTVMLPVVLLGCAWWRRGRLTRQDWFRTTPFFLLALAFGLLSVWFQTHQAFTSGPVQTENFWGRLAGAGWAIWFYLGKAILPVDLNLIYPRWQIDATAPISYLPAALLVGTFFVCWRFRRSWGRPVLFALAYFAVTLFPALGFFDMYFLAISRVSDHFQYLSLIGIVALAAAALSSWLKPGFLNTVGSAAILALALLTSQRARVLANDETLWRDTLARNPTAWPAHNNLACILAEKQKYDEAIGHFEAALKSNPRNAAAEANLARAMEIQGRLDEAETHFLAALAIKPNDVENRKSFASLLAKQGKKEEALKQMRAIIRPGSDLETRLEFAEMLHQTGKGREAVEQYRQALALKPNSFEALNNLAWLLATCADASVRDGAEAVRLAEQACRLSQFSEAVPVATLAAADAEAGRFNEAVANAQKAIGLATAAGNAQLAAVNRQLLALYRAGKSWHEPPAKK